jgi:hypothetical protein
MRNFKFLFFISFFIFTITSCSKNENSSPTQVLDQNQSLNCVSDFRIETSETANFSALNSLNINTLKDELNDAITTVHVIQPNETKPNLHLINVYLLYQNRPSIDVIAYSCSAKNLLSNDNASNTDLFNLLESNQIYSTNQIVFLKNLINQIDLTTSAIEYNQVLSNSKSLLATSNLPVFEKKTLEVNLELIALDELSQRDACWDCIKKNKWKILGWGALIYIPLILACIVSTVGIGTFACISIVLSTVILDRIRRRCGELCDWI